MLFIDKNMVCTIDKGRIHSHKFDGSLGCKLGVPGMELSRDPGLPEDPVWGWNTMEVCLDRATWPGIEL